MRTLAISYNSVWPEQGPNGAGSVETRQAISHGFTSIGKIILNRFSIHAHPQNEGNMRPSPSDLVALPALKVRCIAYSWMWMNVYHAIKIVNHDYVPNCRLYFSIKSYPLFVVQADMEQC